MEMRSSEVSDFTGTNDNTACRSVAPAQEQKSATIFPSAREWEMLKEQASIAIRSGFLPAAINTPEKAIVIALKGRELGTPPMHAFAHIHIIQGKPCISAELQLALIFKNCRGAVIHYAESSPQICTIEATRPGGKAMRFSFSIEEATQAKLMSKDSWKNYPAAMLRARCISIVARALFADAIMGCGYTPEEMGAEVNDEGEVIDLPKIMPPDQASAPPRPVAVGVDRPLARVNVNAPQKISGAHCLACGTELVLSKAGTTYFCPQFKNPGDHTRFPIEKLQEFKNMEKQGA